MAKKRYNPVEAAESLKLMAVGAVENVMDDYISSVKSGSRVFEVNLDIKIGDLAVQEKLTFYPNE